MPYFHSEFFMFHLGISQENTVPMACNFIKERLWRKCFPVNFVKFLRTPFLQNTSGRLFLEIYIFLTWISHDFIWAEA